ncbi:PREDICTED: uncharacterized protein LOC104811244 [Tarenaya hassleriana]|uniref:uncharacterized protein LOC104811244 n=1 Tax=Tarenaya hassleriana TaxID=28532 RepID=UPI00053C86E6|nr:PREDICTED: uncharacterized protein LOC104811244 [Tarenaya hassleriana]
MADKPSRALVLYGDGLARYVDSSHTHIRSLASLASCGFLSLPTAPPSESQSERIVREFSYLLDAAEAYAVTSGGNATGHENKVPILAERFMGLKAALVTDSSTLKGFGKLLGLDVFQLSEICKKSHSSSADAAVSELLKLLGFEEGKPLDANPFDLVFVHMGVSENQDDGNASKIETLDSLVGAIISMAQHGSEIGSHLHLSLALSYGSVSEKDDPIFSVKSPREEISPEFAGLVPRQSYTMQGEIMRGDVRHYCPMLLAQWQYAVTRKDLVDTFSFEAFKKLGGNLVIPADRFIHEVAFKLWKAPKYGA